MSEYQLSPAALRDLDEIWVFIARDSVNAAENWIERLRDQIRLIASRPSIGHVRSGGRRYGSLRFWAYERYVILYYKEGEDVKVIAITQGHRSVKRVIEQRWPS
ncbi:MAG: type II toxin-antitoxin system RelE/ParE family toxin [Acidobacteria bacterium]|nr:type II toxin-antitoxin system RelE/ParE family toxin [Acidobacteriota bacterium]